MDTDLVAMFDSVDEGLGKSTVLSRLGYNARVRELLESTTDLPAKCCFHLVTGGFRCLSICCYAQSDRELLLTFEIFHTLLDESFLLEDWTRSLRNPNATYPFLTSAYSGDFRDRLQQLIDFAETLLGIDEIDRILKGSVWTDFAAHY